MSPEDASGARGQRERGGNAERSTRERILYEASNLFARQGFHGTTTREIATAVGVRQPSLFYHFPSKGAIMQALLASDLDEALPFVLALARGRGPASVRLYRYLRRDVDHLAGSPYNLSGLYTEEVMGDPEFAPWARKRARLHAAVEGMVREGVTSGEFVPVTPALVREAIAGILVRTLVLYSGRPGAPTKLGEEVAAFVLRALLSEPERLPEIRRRALASDA
ncbi:MAG TPA: TetR/AcrR family transcriptional regulator [Actinomycetota bacterium]|nr:TetR/AcrR family transcriptional regulator [Actinomycetota bacterium]